MQNIPINSPSYLRLSTRSRPYESVNPFLVLTHAIWHCRYGSGNVDREPDRGDMDAVTILSRMRSLVWDEYEKERRTSYGDQIEREKR